MTRHDIVQSLRENPRCSVLIIGGGINGAGVFRELALQGVDVLLVDRGDFCSGASATSSHMAHGGIRYLENGEFRLVREAVEERNRLIQNAPHYVKPLPTMIPIFSWLSGFLNAPLKFIGLLDKPAERGAAVIKLGLILYDLYTSTQRTVPRHQFYSHKSSLERFPQLNNAVIGTAQYYDGLILCPERLCLELILDAEAVTPTAKALNYCPVTGASGNTVFLQDEVGGETLAVQPQIVINAAGPWIDLVNDAIGQKTRLIGGTKGSHLVLNHPELRAAIGDHEFFFENNDGRIVLICPLHDKVLVGTSDIRVENADDVACTEEEIDYFLSMISKVFPKIVVQRQQIVFTFAGVRPLPTSKTNSTGQISRDHSIEVIEPSGALAFAIYNLVGGKWTTFRAFAEQTADQVLVRLQHSRRQSSRNLPIGGGKDFTLEESARQAWITQQQQATQWSKQRIATLYERYGTRARQLFDAVKVDPIRGKSAIIEAPLLHKPDYCRHELAFCVQTEKVIHLDDFVLRRSLLGMLGELTLPLLEELGVVIGESLGWSPIQQQAEIERVRTLLARRHLVVL